MIPRKLEKDVEAHLKRKEITLIVGPRQVGKTTLMKLIEKRLRDRGNRTVFLNLDIEEDRKHLTTQQNLIEKIRLEIGNEGGFIFIDEIQRKEEAGVFLKGLYDMNLPYKFIVSGSGSLELKGKIKESLIGRKKVFELEPVNFEEFLNYKTQNRYADKIKEFSTVEKNKAVMLLREYLNYGGYPRVVLSETHEEKLEVIREIFSSYIDRDISELIASSKIYAYSEMVRIIALLRKINPFYRNRTKELIKTPIYYFVDLGLLNFASGKFGNLASPIEFSLPFQNLVFNLLRPVAVKKGYQINFWRSKDGAEVDFVLRIGNRLLPFEVKFKDFKEPSVSRSLRSFIKRYNPEEAYIVSLSSFKPVRVESTRVRFVSIFDILSEESLNL